MAGFVRRVLRDANHVEIVKNLKKKKYGVVDLAAVGNSCPDLIVANGPGVVVGFNFFDPGQHSETILVEIKMPNGRFYLSQLEFLANWPGHAGFAETTEDVEQLFTDPAKRLSSNERQMILDIVAKLRAEEGRDQRLPRVQVAKFERLYAAAGGRL